MGGLPIVVIVEDEDDLAVALSRTARVLGFDPRLARSFGQAKDLFRDLGGPDAILLDVRLPDGSGLDLLAELREMGVRCPVMVMTAHGGIEIIERCYSLRARHLRKPGVGGEITEFLMSIRQSAFGAAPEQIEAFARRLRLTPAQTAVLGAACIDRNHAAIADRLGPSVATVKKHVCAILTRSGASDLRELVDWVRAERVVPKG